MTPARPLLALGLMSGTSADGVTAALVELRGRALKVLRHETFPYAAALRRRVLGAADLKAPALSRLNFELGEAFARAARALLRGGAQPLVIGSHGQTVWHGPEESPPNTLQLAEPAVIAERTGLPVVADFRPRDVAAGGQGAPLVPGFEAFLFGDGPVRALLNIGGIANVSVVGRGRLWTAFDTGPGNCLMDLAVRRASSGRLSMDRGGRLAARGRADVGLVGRLLADPYFRKPPPKSLERTRFGESTLRRLGRPTPRGLPDLLAALSLLTARSIENACRRFILPRCRPVEIVVSGGGALNAHLMGLLRERLSPLPVRVSSALGLPPMAKEAACFAWMAARALRRRANSCARATGARGERVLGKLVLP